MNEDVNLLHKRGYLKKDFQFFHLKDQKNLEFEFHYHDFLKIIIFLSGKVNYRIEGKNYNLKPWDILLIGNNEIHKPEIDGNVVYERIILWVNPGFLLKHNTETCNLLSCFEFVKDQKMNLIRLLSQLPQQFKQIVFDLEEACRSNEFGNHILKNALFLQLFVYLNRLLLGFEMNFEKNTGEYEEDISKIIEYINAYLSESLSVEDIAQKFYMSKYYLMRKFKKQTGYTIHNYLQQKRLLKARDLIQQGLPVIEASFQSGFGDYSTFLRAFKKMFDTTPKKYNEMVREWDKVYMRKH